MSMSKKDKNFWEEEDEKIHFYENLIKMLKQKLFKVDDSGKPQFTGSMSDLKELVDTDIKLMTFKRKRYGF